MMYPKVYLVTNPAAKMLLVPSKFNLQIDNPESADIRSSEAFEKYLNSHEWAVVNVGAVLVDGASVNRDIIHINGAATRGNFTECLNWLLDQDGADPDHLEVEGFFYRTTGWFGSRIEVDGEYRAILNRVMTARTAAAG